MFYNLGNSLDKERFKARCNALYKKGALVEMTESVGKTIRQNSYLHLLIGVVAMETGNTIEYTKREYFKRLVNPSLFLTEKEDPFIGKVKDLKSINDLTKEDLSTAIDRFKRWGAENGIYLPDPTDDAILRDIAIEMQRQRTNL